MQSIRINNEIYTYGSDIKQEEKYVFESFNNLTRETFGFDFYEWNELGYFTNKYQPYYLIDNNQVVSNVSINYTDFLYNRQLIKGIQIGTVMTKKEYRNKGLARVLLKKVIEENENRCSFMYLFANDKVLEFYPKFKFYKQKEYEYSLNNVVFNNSKDFSKVDMNEKSNIDFVYNILKKYISDGKFALINNVELIMFHLTSHLIDCVYYSKRLNCLVIFKEEKSEIIVYGIYYKNEMKLLDVIKRFPCKDVKNIRFYYVPKEIDILEEKEHKEEDTTLFVYTNIFSDDKVIIPKLSHA